MKDKSQNGKDVLEMRRLFWRKVNGEISHEELMKELDRIASKQGTLVDKETEACK